ncbi:FkbM family methyltransferase [Longimicrobium terrae]|uniref:FkbM family methyltransferase n=1 Tax=Longimicrobium terrae TaxID=1639882 RepID=A0A841GXQ3_9BACT|nr:FkbM family methyltransferase [Longimicrobium terrae]MBB4636131.1 FkbM family methyltransferase [Longimicrobium terrae]MBB6070526.1 FkbM family methyltransferase [Longimicrobium terrae]NNC29515.1 FkbM family methyltransferase [Longimicrobium terrae]
MLRSAGRLARHALRRFGIDVARYEPVPPHLRRRARLLSRFAPSVVLDVGANSGIYGRELRACGYAGRIVSFEPLPSAFEALSGVAAADGAWEAHPVALSSTEGERTLFRSGNSWSSSLHDMDERHLRVAPDSAYVGAEAVKTITLDSLFGRLVRPGERAWLKIDTQGHEDAVLAGAAASLPRIETVEIEMSLLPLYAGQVLFPELYAWLTDAGFTCLDLQPNLLDPQSEELLAVDGIFRRADGGTRAG